MMTMRNHALVVQGEAPQVTRWVRRPGGSGTLSRLFGGLLSNIRTGINAAISLAIATFPFASFWLFAWWAGWENSFNKGYEQSFVGPLLGVSGIAVFAVIMVYLPMALVHQAVTQRAFSFFELGHVRRVVAQTGWGYVIWAVATVICALPIFASRGLPVFAEGMYPPLAQMSAEEVAQVRSGIAFVTALYIFCTSVVLKRWSAGIFARASKRMNAPRSGKIHRIGRGLRFAALFAVWTGLAVLIFVGQFLNHDWHIWLSHPYVFLPWVG